MKKFVMCCMLALMGCGDEAEEPKPVGTKPTLLGMEALEASCDIDGNFSVKVRLEGTGKVYCTDKCSGWPDALDGVWEGTVFCGKGNDQLRLLCQDATSGSYAPRLDTAPGDRRYCF